MVNLFVVITQVLLLLYPNSPTISLPYAAREMWDSDMLSLVQETQSVSLNVENKDEICGICILF